MVKQTSSPSANKSDLISLYRQALRTNVSLDELDQKITKLSQRNAVSNKVENDLDKTQEKKLKNKLPQAVRLGALFLPVFLILSGIALVGSAILPIIVFYIKTAPVLSSNQLVAPVPDSKVLDITPPVIASEIVEFVEASEDSFGQYNGPIIIDEALDYTNLSNWFAAEEDLGQFAGLDLEKVSDEYVIDIPKLKITNAKVKVGGTDLDKSLIQYPGTALPGKLGSPVIFGHSILRQFYNPKETNPRRYNSIFSIIMTLEAGDKIYLSYENVKYTYAVTEKLEVKPTDTYILAQNYDARSLKLVTCVPEGTYLRRGVVMAQLIKE